MVVELFLGEYVHRSLDGHNGMGSHLSQSLYFGCVRDEAPTSECTHCHTCVQG